MQPLRYLAMPSAEAAAYRGGHADANGQTPEQHISPGGGMPCRHCLQNIAADEPYLILAYRPFPAPQPYAELGPIFLHARPCERYAQVTQAPSMFLARPGILLRGYGADDRIVYGTGQVVPGARIAEEAHAILARPDVAYVHARSASNNCFQCRIERGAHPSAASETL
jgi:Protein of unknown function (DUF1203)